MSRHPSRRLAGVSATAVAALAFCGVTLPAHAVNPNTDAAAPAGTDTSSVIVTLTGEPLATGNVDRNGGKVDFNGTKTKNAQAQLAQQRNALRKWLQANAPKAQVTGEFDTALNAVAVALNGTSADIIKGAPGVARVDYEALYTPQSADPDLSLIKAQTAWSEVGATTTPGAPQTWAGYGVKVGVIDTGIDVTHPCFNDAGYPKTQQLGNTTYTNNKVIVARVFYNKINKTTYDEAPIGEHGTHVAGTIGCDPNTPAIVDGVRIPYNPSGVAPGVQFGSYNVFPGDIKNARSEDIFSAMEAAAKDGMQVINMSLGGTPKGGARDLEAAAVDRLDRAGIVVAVAGGNDGPGAMTEGSPGTAERALTSGASSVGHYVGVPIRNAAGAQVSVAAIGAFNTPQTDVTAPLAVVRNADGSFSTACNPLPSGSLAGKIALISRGACTFATKVANAKAAGAVAVVIVNNSPGDPIAMAQDEANPTDEIAVMAPLSDRDALIALDGQAVTLGAQKAYKYTGNNNILMDFSSWGPTPNTFLIKPDVVAPGGNVISSIPNSYCKGDAWVAQYGCWAFMSGTSMATPHLAGSAAVVRAAHPDWDAWMVRSAIINTAVQNGVMKTKAITTPETDVMKVGAGLEDLSAAVVAPLVFSQPSISFGDMPAAAGASKQITIQVTNVSKSAQTAKVSVGEQSGPGQFGTTTPSVSLAPGATANITVTFTIGAGVTGPSQAHLHVGNEHLALYAYMR